MSGWIQATMQQNTIVIVICFSSSFPEFYVRKELCKTIPLEQDIHSQDQVNLQNICHNILGLEVK
jgi:hypothetical protein